ncbi:unnamed protein product [Lactuca saligna]|uniref:Transposase (putative) gypsy type domain-containing protein n=1 Tax=Lactuca saligna TaxID=75948 RepID=A0AA35YHD8_LACSI|nr:unnamed protein product [Lactuca saligna]
MLASSHIILLALIRLYVLNALISLADYLSSNPDYSCRNFLTSFPFEFAFTVIGMGDDMSIMAFEVDCCMLEGYCDEYHLSLMLGFQVPSSSSSILDAPPCKVGFYLRHLVCGLWLPPSRIILKVLYFYKLHLVQLCPNAASNIVTFEVFYVSHKIPLHVSLFRYFYRLKKYGDWFSFSSCHFPLSPYLGCSNGN